MIRFFASPRKARARATWLPVLLLLSAATPGWSQTAIMAPPAAGPQGGHRMPGPKGVSSQSGLAMTLLMKESAPPTGGYVTLKVDFESPSPLTADTSLTVAVHMYDFYDSAGATIEADLDMLTGDTRKSLELRIPAYAMSYALYWDVWVDGRHDRHLSQKKQNPQMVPTVVGQGQGRNEPALRVLTPLPLGKIASVRALGTTTTVAPDTAVLQFTPGSETEVVSKPLPEEWLEYSPHDVVVIDIPSLKALKSDRPDAFEALAAWVRSGGNLWVQDVGDEWENLAELSELLGIDFDQGAKPEPAKDGFAPGSQQWNFIDLSATNAAAGPTMPGALVGGVQEEDFAELERELATGNRGQEEKPFWSEDWFAVRKLGWGTVGAFKEQFTDFPRPFHAPEVATGFGFWTRHSWDFRHGTQPRSANPAFSNWLIPGVGKAPVVGFQVLITLFIVTIGPVNYWLLKRARRLHLLVLTVPAFAALVTVTLLVYGVLADGWAERVRGLSYTYIDSQSQRASSWSRLSYYAAFAPRDGLAFPLQSQVYPIEPGADEGFAEPASSRSITLEWTDDAQHLSRGWLNSRTPTQYLVLETSREAKGLRIAPHAQGLQAISPFTRPLKWVLVVDEEGKWFESRDVAPETTFPLTEVDRAEAIAHFRQLVQDHEPNVPAELEEARLPRAFRGYNYWGYTPDYAVSFDASLLSDRWNQLTGREGYEPLGLANRTYLVVAEEALVTSLGLESPSQEASLHFVEGDW